MAELRFGIVGTGWISGIIADAIDQSSGARVAAIASRRQETAEAFAAARPGVKAFVGVEALLEGGDVDAVYVATPTVAKEHIALAAVAAGKHVLVDKPMPGEVATLRMVEAAAARGLLFMDATHFVHHPRTRAICSAMRERIGLPRSLVTTFYFPLEDRANIRLQPALEPTGAVGDMGWYAMRAVVEYLQPEGPIRSVAAVSRRDPETRAVIAVTGMIAFDHGKASTFDFGYTAGTMAMDLNLVGTTGIISMDDFVLDWTSSIVFQNPDIETGYVHRTGVATRKDARFVATPSPVPQHVLMIERFAELATGGGAAARQAFAGASLRTQQFVDAIWGAVREA
jgi:predicted dehydrogenase